MLTVASNADIRFLQPDYLYRKATGVSQSELKEVLRSPAHWLARYGPDAEPFYPSAAMIMGTALHCRVLEPEAFDTQFVDRNEKPRELTITELKAELDVAGIEYKKTAKKAELEELLYPDGKPVDERTTLSGEDFKAVCGMADALRSHAVAGEWFDPGRKNYRRQNEISLYVDDVNGMPIKGRVDRLEKTEAGWMILDLKTTDDASPSSFQKKSYNLSYHLQAAFYVDLVARVLKEDPANVQFQFCAIERKAPYAIGIYTATDALLDYGRGQYLEAMDLLKRAKESDVYEAYAEDPQPLNLPNFVKTDTVQLPNW